MQKPSPSNNKRYSSIFPPTENQLSLFFSPDLYIVSSKPEIRTFRTGAPPDAPSHLYLIACTETAARIGFDPFIENKAEIKTLRVHYGLASSQTNAKEISMDLTPDSTEFTILNLIARTTYSVTIYGITDEYLNENCCRDVSQLPKKLKSSIWLPNISLQFKTSGCEPASEIKTLQASTKSIELSWKLPKAFGSTKYLGQRLRWKLEQSGAENCMELDCTVMNATIPGILPSGSYKISIDAVFSKKISLEGDNDESSWKEFRLTTIETVLVRFRVPAGCEQPEIYLTGYTAKTVDFQWNKPDMVRHIEHPEKNNEKIKIQLRLIGYRIDIDEQKPRTLDQDQDQYVLTECQLGEKYYVQLVAQTIIQNVYINNKVI